MRWIGRKQDLVDKDVSFNFNKEVIIMKLFLINPLTGRIDTKYLSLKKAKELGLVVYRDWGKAYEALQRLDVALQEVTPRQWFEGKLLPAVFPTKVKQARQSLYEQFCGKEAFYTTYS